MARTVLAVHYNNTTHTTLIRADNGYHEIEWIFFFTFCWMKNGKIFSTSFVVALLLVTHCECDKAIDAILTVLIYVIIGVN